jgi:hypothetical protein
VTLDVRNLQNCHNCFDLRDRKKTNGGLGEVSFDRLSFIRRVPTAAQASKNIGTTKKAWANKSFAHAVHYLLMF